jgi:hypothetical protein
VEIAIGDIIEKFGIVGLMVVGAYFVIRFFMNQSTSKDRQLVDFIERTEERMQKRDEQYLAAITGVAKAVEELRLEVRTHRSGVP